jgi:hypothetical protein
MPAADDYRRKAEECVAQAQLAEDPQIRAELLTIAAGYRRLADQVSAERKLPGPLPPPGSPRHGADKNGDR